MIVGRAEELVRLHGMYDATVAAPASHLVVLLGSPGLGKSRLIDETNVVPFPRSPWNTTRISPRRVRSRLVVMFSG